jgi:dienelactone hydrolase
VTEVLLFHHALGVTPGCVSFADRLRAEGHVVHLPDLYGGRRFTEVQDGVRFAEEELGIEALLARASEIAEELPHALVYAGFSLGVLPAQMLAQTRPAPRGAILLHSTVPPSEFGAGSWPPDVPLQIHIAEQDPFALEGDLAVARELAACGVAELHLYPGDAHLFADESTPDYDAAAAGRLHQRVLHFLERIG